MARRPRRQECRRRFDGHCFLCGECRADVLDAHRLYEGADGGTYAWGNLVTLCAVCHRLVHARRLALHRWHLTTAGCYLLHCTIDGVDGWVADGEFPLRRPGAS